MLFVVKYLKKPFRLLFGLIDNLLVRIFNKNPTFSPLLVALEVTNECNARCQFCFHWNQCRDNELSLDRQVEIIKELGKMKTWILALSGGEPLIYPHIETLLQVAQEEKITVSLSTNGYNLKEMASILVKYDVRYISISADSDIAEEHDSERKLPGLFDHIIDGIEEFKRVRKYNNYFSIRIIVHAKNIRRIDQIISFWKQYSDNIHLIPITYGNRDENKAVLSEYLDFKPSDLSNFQEILEKHKLQTPSHRQIPGTILGNQVVRKCFSGSLFISITPSGEVFNCNEFHFKMGDIKNSTIKEVLRSERARHSRDRIKSGVNCRCDSSCAMMNTYLNKIDFL